MLFPGSKQMNLYRIKHDVSQRHRDSFRLSTSSQAAACSTGSLQQLGVSRHPRGGFAPSPCKPSAFC